MIFFPIFPARILTGRILRERPYDEGTIFSEGFNPEERGLKRYVEPVRRR
jgi:hypothetical protein